MQEKARFHVIYLVVAVIGVLLVQQFMHDASTVAVMPYSEFQQLLKAHKVSEVEIVGDTLRGTLKEPREGKQRFITTRVDPQLATDLDEAGVRYARHEENTFLPNLLSWVIPSLVFFFVWAFFIRRMAERAGPGGGMMAVGKSKAKVYVETDTKVTFADVAGVDEAKDELKETVEFLKNPAAYGRLGARMPKGVLLVGPPGTGKTLLARAVAGEAGVPFFSISGSEFVEMFVGVGAARVRDLFEQARKQAPSIIFIDELDALGRSRNAAPYMGGHDEKEQTLNQLLVEMDGFDASSGVVLLAATNRPEILDPALLRAGRFDRQVLVDRPDKNGRLDVLRVHVRKAKLAPQLNLEAVAALTPGFTGADLANLVNEAALVATRRGANEVTLDDFTAAVERIVAGLEKRNRLLNPVERKIVAYHETGHALVARSIPGQDPVQKISIIPRGIGALGYTLQRPTEDRYLMTRTELENKLMVLLGGRAAEHIVFGHLSTGAADDLSKATEIARSMAMRYAMVPELGNVAYDTEPSPFLQGTMGNAGARAYSDDTARQIDAAIRDIVDNAFKGARALLSKQRALLETAAVRLLEKETLTEEDLAVVWGSLQPQVAEPAQPA